MKLAYKLVQYRPAVHSKSWVLCNYISKHPYSFPSKTPVTIVLHLVNMNIAVYTYMYMNAFRWIEPY